MTDSATLAKANRHYLIAPAGCGKTYLIVEAVVYHADGKQLVLTHTHAGVDVLRRRFKGKTTNVALDTIDSLALRLVRNFPKTTGIDPTIYPKNNREWKLIHEEASKLFQIDAHRKAIQASYTGMYVDEYQDCSVSQHSLVVAMANLIPCRILGDPLQGIFDFGDNEAIDWKTHVESEFNELDSLQKPWRWLNGGNRKLGFRLLSIREQLEKDQQINLELLKNGLSWGSVWYVGLNGNDSDVYTSQMQICQWKAKLKTTPRDESILVLHPSAQRYHSFTGRLGGQYRCVERIDCKALFKFAKSIENNTEHARAQNIADFAAKCMTKVKDEKVGIKTFCEGLCKKKISRTKKHPSVTSALTDVCNNESLSFVLPALEEIQKMKKTRFYRRELFDEMCKALKEHETGRFASLEEAARFVRDRTRHSGRRSGKRAVGTTWLLKGLECDHVIILDADQLSKNNLYVALTRAKKSITILSRNPILKPA